MPQSAVEFQNRIAGSSFKSVADWQANRSVTLTSPDANNPVEAARKVVGNTVPLSKMGWKQTSRELYFVTPNFPPLIGRSIRFLVSVDTNTAAKSGQRPVRRPLHRDKQPQIFTKLPWTKHVTEPRKEQFEDLCNQLSSQLGLHESTQTPYAEALQHVP